MKLTADEKAVFVRLVGLVGRSGERTGEALKYGIADLAVYLYPRVSPYHAYALNLMLKVDYAPPQLFDEIAAGKFKVRELSQDEFEVVVS